MVKLVGSAIGNLAEFLLDVGTGIANLVTNPEETIDRMKGQIFGFMKNIVSTVGQFFDRFFTLDNLLSLVENLFGFEASETIRKWLVKKNVKEFKED